MENSNGGGRSRCPDRGLFDDNRAFNRFFLLALFILSLLAFVRVIRIFLLDITLAAVFATLFHPLYRWILRLLGGTRRGWSSFASCVLIILGILTPLVFLSTMVANQAADLYSTAMPQIRSMLDKGDTPGLVTKILDSRLLAWVKLQNIDWQSAVQETLKSVGTATATIINRTSQATFGFIIDFFIIFFTMFYFFRDGSAIASRVKYVIPLNETYKEKLFARFTSISRATVRGTLLIGIVQGSIGALTLLLFGVGTWLLWGVVMVILSIVPVVGTYVVLIPAGIIKIINGHLWQGLAIITICLAVISTADNVLRPVLVGHDAKMHDLLIFFSTLGGISIFGVMGFIIGPLVAAIFITVLEIYSVEFQKQLNYSHLARRTSTRTGGGRGRRR